MFRNENHASGILSIAGKKLIMFTKITEFRFSPGNFSFRWLRPSAVWLMDERGQEQIIKISDPTRQTLLFIFGFVSVGSTLLWLLKLSNLRLNRV